LQTVVAARPLIPRILPYLLFFGLEALDDLSVPFGGWVKSPLYFLVAFAAPKSDYTTPLFPGPYCFAVLTRAARCRTPHPGFGFFLVAFSFHWSHSVRFLPPQVVEDLSTLAAAFCSCVSVRLIAFFSDPPPPLFPQLPRVNLSAL